jgi:hypothetical protein
LRYYKTIIKYNNEEVGTVINPLNITTEIKHNSLYGGSGTPMYRINSSKSFWVESDNVFFKKGFNPSLTDRFDIVTDIIDLPIGIKMSKKKRIKKKYKKKYGTTVILRSCIVQHNIQLID